MLKPDSGKKRPGGAGGSGGAVGVAAGGGGTGDGSKVAVGPAGLGGSTVGPGALGGRTAGVGVRICAAPTVAAGAAAPRQIQNGRLATSNKPAGRPRKTPRIIPLPAPATRPR